MLAYKHLRTALILLFTLWALSKNSFPASGVLTDDASVSSKSPGLNLGKAPALVVDGNSSSYIKFDLSVLPANTRGVNVSKATLTIWVSIAPAGGVFDVIRVTSPWHEETLTFGNAPSLGQVELTAVTVTQTTTGSFIALDLTALAKDWVNGVLPNNGIALFSHAASNVAVFFDSKENPLTGHEARLDIDLVNQGPQGPAGPPGPIGQAPRGTLITAGFSSNGGSPSPLPATSGAIFPNPPGLYVIDARLVLENRTTIAQNIRCTLTTAAGDVIDSTVVTLPAARTYFGIANLIFSGTASDGTGRLLCSCHSDEGVNLSFPDLRWTEFKVRLTRIFIQ